MIYTLALDPITLTAIGLGVSSLIGAGTAVEGAINKPKAPSAPPTTSPAAPATNPQGSSTSAVPQQTPSFLAAATTPQSGQTVGGGSGKTLLGQ